MTKSTRIRSIHPINGTQLAKVIEAMREIGPPTIRAVYWQEAYMAIEGTHRIEAARLLGNPIRLVEVEPAEIIDVANMDIADNWADPVPMTAGEVAEGLFAECNGIYSLLDGGYVELLSEARWPPIPPIS